MNLFTQAAPEPPQARPAPEPPRAASVASSRATDPPTSRKAAQAHERGGKAELHRERLLNEVCTGPGRTAVELAQRLDGIDRHEASRRLPELRDRGLVESRDPRKCSIKGTSMVTWWATAAGLEAGPKRG